MDLESPFNPQGICHMDKDTMHNTPPLHQHHISHSQQTGLHAPPKSNSPPDKPGGLHTKIL